MIIPFDFEGDEVVAVLEAICMYGLELAQPEVAISNRAKLASLRRFLDKMEPVVERGLAEAREMKAHMN